MTNAALAARLVEALEAAAGPDAALVSVNITVIAPGEGAISARVERRTRTLLFAQAECVGAAGARIATAASVHRIA